jgi:DNA modification methylase
VIALVLAQSADLRPSRRGERPNPRLWTWLEYHLTNTDPDDCWLWEGPVGSWGYPVIGMFSRIWKGNRLIWTVLNGPIPDGLLVCHFCDVPACMNPFHLWLGTNRDNARDMAAKGRAAAQVTNDHRERTTHRALTPFAACSWIVDTWADPGCLVIDPFAGLGTIGLAARSHGFDYLGAELDPEYARVANKAFETETIMLGLAG